MNLSEMGFVYQYLLKYRSVESKPSNRRAKKNERQVSSILLSANYDDIENFNSFLASQGMILKLFDDTDLPGIALNGKVWILAREPDETPASFLSIERIKEGMKIKDTDSSETSNVWFLHIWLIYLYLVYTAPGRGVSQVSGYIDAMFLDQQLIDAVKEHVELIRNTGVSKGAEEKVVNILTDEKGTDIARRVNLFLSMMCDSSLLIKLTESEYQQTILGAVEVADGFERSMRHSIVPDDAVLDNIINTMSPDTEVPTTEKGGM